MASSPTEKPRWERDGARASDLPSAVHATFSNVQLARVPATAASLAARPELQRFLSWIADQPPDFYAPARKRQE